MTLKMTYQFLLLIASGIVLSSCQSDTDRANEVIDAAIRMSEAAF